MSSTAPPADIATSIMNLADSMALYLRHADRCIPGRRPHAEAVKAYEEARAELLALVTKVSTPLLGKAS